MHAVVARSAFPSQNVLSTLLEVEMSKKCTPFWREAHVKVNMSDMSQKHYMFGPLLDVPMSFGLALGIVHLVKVSKTGGFCSSSKNDGRCGTFGETLQRCMSRGGGSTRHVHQKC